MLFACQYVALRKLLFRGSIVCYVQSNAVVFCDFDDEKRDAQSTDFLNGLPLYMVFGHDRTIRGGIFINNVYNY